MKKKRKGLRLFVAILFVVGIVVGIYFALGYYKVGQIKGFAALAKSGAFAPPPPAITTVTTKVSEWKPTFDSVGSVVAINGVTVSTDLPGIVTKIAFESGSKVKTGDLLIQENIEQETAQLNQAAAQAYIARLNLNRNRDLLGKKTISQQDFDTTDATYRQMEASVEQYRQLIERKTLRARFDGVIGIRQVNLGQYLNSGDAVATLQSFDPIYVNFNLPQANLQKLANGQTVQLTLDAYRNVKFTGKITAINPLVDQNSRNVQVQATLPNPDSKLTPGMYGQVSVELPETEQVIAVPSSSIHYAPYGDSVFIVSEEKDKDGKLVNGKDGKPKKVVTERFVKLGTARGDLTAVNSGLKPGEEVATSGVFRLRSGSNVTVNNEVRPEAELAPNPADS